MINQSVSQETRGDDATTRTISELTSSSGSSSYSSSSVTTQGNGRNQQTTGVVRTNQPTNDPHTQGVTTQQTNMPTSRHITHIPNTGGIFTTRVEIRHEAIPDLLHSHVVPSHSQHSSHVTRQGQPLRQPPPAHILNQRGQVHVRHHPQRHVSRQQQQHRRRTRTRSQSDSDDEPCKAGCFSCLAASTSFRWILVVLSLLGVCCVVTGIILAALHAAGNSFLFLAIMFIGKLKQLITCILFYYVQYFSSVPVLHYLQAILYNYCTSLSVI